MFQTHIDVLGLSVLTLLEFYVHNIYRDIYTLNTCSLLLSQSLNYSVTKWLEIRSATI